MVAAHPEGFLAPVGNVLWKGLAQVGMDISMTPLTADMTLMLGKDQKSFYQRKIYFEISDGKTWQELSWDQLRFYEVRVPLLLLLELVEGGVDVKGHVHGICYNLKTINPSMQSFRVNLQPSQPLDQALGFGKEWGLPLV